MERWAELPSGQEAEVFSRQDQAVWKLRDMIQLSVNIHWKFSSVNIMEISIWCCWDIRYEEGIRKPGYTGLRPWKILCALLRNLIFLLWIRIPLVFKQIRKKSPSTNEEDALKGMSWGGARYVFSLRRWGYYSSCSGPLPLSKDRRWPLSSLSSDLERKILSTYFLVTRL